MQPCNHETMQLNLPTIETQRLILKEITVPTIGLLLETFTSDKLQKFLDLDTEVALKAEIFKLSGATHSNRISFKLWYLIEKESNRIIGDVAYHLWFLHHHRAEIGYGLRREEDKRKGYMSEALVAVLDYGFKQMNLQRIEAYVSPNNIASLQSVRKFGFRQEGRFHSHYHNRQTEQVDDSLAFALLLEDYQALNAKNIPLENFIQLFEQRNLPAKYWTHEAHLTVGVWYLSQYTKVEATCWLRSGIIAHNIASGGKNTPTNGYHETITLFWIEIIHAFLQKLKGVFFIEEKIEQFLNSPFSDKNLLYEYYTKKRLFSTLARAVWVAPDLKSFELN